MKSEKDLLLDWYSACHQFIDLLFYLKQQQEEFPKNKNLNNPKFEEKNWDQSFFVYNFFLLILFSLHKSIPVKFEYSDSGMCVVNKK